MSDSRGHGEEAELTKPSHALRFASLLLPHLTSPEQLTGSLRHLDSWTVGMERSFVSSMISYG